MTDQRPRVFCKAVLISLSLLFISKCWSETRPGGIVVETVSVEPGRGVQAVDYLLQAGDVLLTVSCGRERRPVETPWDLKLVEIDRFVCKDEPVMSGIRNGKPKQWRVGQGTWNVNARPVLDDKTAASFDRAGMFWKEGKKEEAIEIWSHLDDIGAWWPAWWKLRTAHLYVAAEDWPKADEWFAKTLAAIPNSEVARRSIVSFEWADTYMSRSDWESAIDKYRSAIKDARTADNALMTARSELELGWAFVRKSDYDQANTSYQDARKTLEEIAPDSMLTAMVINEIGELAQTRGDYALAGNQYLKSAAIVRKWVPHSVELAKEFNNLGSLRVLVGDNLPGERYFTQALGVIQFLRTQSFTPPEDRVALGKYAAYCLHNMGVSAEHRNAHRTARTHYLEALRLKKALMPGSISVSITLTRLAAVTLSDGDPKMAEDYGLQSLAIQERTAPGSAALATTHYVLGDIKKSRGLIQEAKEHYEQALQIQTVIQPGTREQADSLAALGSIAHEERALKVAADYYSRAVDAFELQVDRAGATSQVRAGFRANHEYYRGYISVLLDQQEPAAALSVLERFRARSLLELLAQAHVTAESGVDPTLLAKKRELQRLMTEASDRRLRLTVASASNGRLRQLDEEISRLVEEYRTTESNLALQDPDYFALTKPQAPVLADLQQRLLGPDTLLLEYFLADQQSYVWAVTNDSLRVYKLGPRRAIEAAASTAYRLLAGRNEAMAPNEQLWGPADRALRQSLDRLSRLVLAPVKGELSRPRIVVVNDGMLHYIPFSALRTNQGGPKSWEGRELVLDHEVIGLPSASVLGALRQRATTRATPGGLVAVLADPVFNRLDSRVPGGRETQVDDSRGDAALGVATAASLSTVSSVRGDTALRRLPYTRNEAENVLRTVPRSQSLLALGYDATRALATSPQLTKYKTVHFATHAMVDEQYPELTGLVFSLLDRRGRPEKGFLSLADIYNMSLPVDMVVLSACETGVGKLVKGEGFISLTRGFMYAGATRVIASMWKVDDGATAAMMGNFYRGMEIEHLPPSAAFRRAQMKMQQIPRWKSPYYWAGFVLQGDWQ